MNTLLNLFITLFEQIDWYFSICLLEDCLMLIDGLLIHNLFNVYEDTKNTRLHLERMFYIQQTDFTYNSVNFDDPISNLSYFKKRYRTFSHSSEKEIDEYFKYLMQVGYQDEDQEGFNRFCWSPSATDHENGSGAMVLFENYIRIRLWLLPSSGCLWWKMQREVLKIWRWTAVASSANTTSSWYAIKRMLEFWRTMRSLSNERDASACYMFILFTGSDC